MSRFFEKIIRIQYFVSSFEDKYIKYRNIITKCCYITLFASIVLLLLKQIILGGGLFIFSIIVRELGSIFNWRNSVRKFLRMSIVCNAYLSATIASLLTKTNDNMVVLVIFIIIYSLVWMMLSLLANSEVSLLVNEIITGLSTTIFTIGTYINSFALSKLPDPSKIYEIYTSYEVFEKKLSQGNGIAQKFFVIGLLQILNEFFLIFLPIIGVTALSIIIIKIKIYYMNKMKIIEL